jgi:DNA-binding CsgD family transcriptional regulator/tetratricopeptide (TPR) repeat protein
MSASDAGTSAGPFFGRQREIGLVAAAIDDVAAGSPRIVLIEGAPGIGKSALIDRVLRDADLRVAYASGDEHETSLPFGVLDQLLRHAPDDLEVSPLAPDFSLPDVMAGGARLVDLLGVLQTEGPVALVVDDLQWCDPPSLHAIVFALRRLRVDQVVALLAVRSEESAHLPRGLHELVATQSGVRIPLAGLGRNELRRLAEDMGCEALPQRALARLTAHTRGNPLYARALLQELDPRALISRAGIPLPAPRAYASLVLTRLRQCSPAAVRLVGAAAVLGNRCPLSEAALLADLEGPLPALEESCSNLLLRMVDTPVGPELVFTHPLARAAVYHDLGPTRRGELHERVASSNHDERVRLSHRVAGTVGDDPDLAEELASFAARQLAAGPAAAQAAADALQAAARVAGSQRERQGHLLQAVECLIAAGELGTATHLSEALVGSDDVPAALYIRGALALHTGRADDAEHLLGSAWGMVDGRDDPALAAGIAGQLAISHLRRANAEEVVSWSRRSLNAGLPRIPLGMSASTTLALGMITAGRYEEAAAAVPPLPDHDRDRERQPLEGRLARGIVSLWSDDPRAARSDLEDTLRTARREGMLVPALFALYHLSEVEFRLGSWDDAVAHGELAASMAEDADQFGMLASVHGNAALPFACRGAWEAAEAHVEAALTATRILPDATNVTWAHSARATLAAARGDHAAVVESAEIIASTLHGGGDQPGIKPWRVLGAEALAALGEADRADRLLRPHEERARACDLPLARAATSRARGMVELARGDPVSAERHFEIALLGTSIAPFERAQTELAYGAFLRRGGNRRHADSLLRTAEATFHALGAAPYLERTQRELAACGLTPARRTPDARYKLTPQEQTVAHLVTKGLRNREVAAELVVSVKTVEYHLSNIYRKLQVSSRTRLAAELTGDDVPLVTARGHGPARTPPTTT